MVGIFRQIALATDSDGGPRILDVHHGFMPSITVQGGGPSSPPQRATGTWTPQVSQVDRDRSTETLCTGEYSDVYVREDGRWVLAECLFTPGWSVTRTLDDATVTYPEVHSIPGAATAGADS